MNQDLEQPPGRCLLAIPLVLMGLPLLLGLGRLPWPELEHLDRSAPWLFAIDSRVRETARGTTGPKVIFAGGSSLIFGLHAESLSRKIGRPAINYGLHAGIDLDNIADRVLGVVGPGDLVVLAVELPLLRAEIEPNSIRQDWMYHIPRNDPRAPRQRMAGVWSLARARYRAAQIRQRLEAMGATWLLHRLGPPAARGRPPPSPYSLQALRPDGALDFPRPEPRPWSQWVVSPPPKIKRNQIPHTPAAQALRTLKVECDRRQARLLVMPAMRLRVSTAGNQERMLKLETAWLEYAASQSVPALLPAGGALLEPEFGYDTPNHLNDRGVEIMEERIAAAIGAHLP